MKFSKENSIDLKNINLDEFLSTIIDKNYYKKNNSYKILFLIFLNFFIKSIFI